jgi:hypothetical protein
MAKLVNAQIPSTRIRIPFCKRGWLLSLSGEGHGVPRFKVKRLG